MKERSLAAMNEELVACARCPRLVAWREQVAREKRRMYMGEEYWGRPVPGFGDARAKLVVVGLAPGAHGANRTGRMFTGDRSGDFLYAALHRAGVASQPTSVSKDDGLALRSVFITAAARCAPPDNKPSTEELSNCRPWLEEELAKLTHARAFLALGKTGYDAVIKVARDRHGKFDAPDFAHGARAAIPDPRGASASKVPLVASYHVSQQNTQTGRLTADMFDAVLAVALREAGLDARRLRS